MKKIKYILLSAVVFSFFLITACSTTKSVPQDDVYYSTSPHNNLVKITTTTTTDTQNTEAKQTAYKEGAVETVVQSSGQATSGDEYDVDYSARLKRFHESNDTTLDYYDEYYEGKTVQSDTEQSNSSSTTIITPNVFLSLGFGSPYFGSSWSFGFGSYYGWNVGFGWDYPYYSWGYYPPYYIYYPPYYGYYPPYYSYYPCYTCYYPPYYPGYPEYGYGESVYQPRIRRGGGSSIPRGTIAGGSVIYRSPNANPAARDATSTVATSQKRVPVNPEGRDGKLIKPDGTNNNRPAGSMRYNAELAKKRSADIHAQGKLNKPGGNAVRKSTEGGRSSGFGISESRNRAVEGYNKPPAYRREESMPKPRFQKPKQYQSLESRSTRSSKEFYRAPARPSNPEYRKTNTKTVQPQTVHRQNVYRPASSQNSVYRSSRTRSGIKVYNAPTRSVSSPNTFRAPVRRNSSTSTSSAKSFSAPTRSFSAPARTSSSSRSSSGTVRRSSSSGGIKR